MAVRTTIHALAAGALIAASVPAFADHGGRGGWDRDGWNRGHRQERVVVERTRVVERPVYVDRTRVVERPVYVDRPVYVEQPVYRAPQSVYGYEPPYPEPVAYPAYPQPRVNAVGVAAGAAVGAVLGSQIGHGPNRAATAAIGAAIGGVLGSQF